jgi:hypothetical protein
MRRARYTAALVLVAVALAAMLAACGGESGSTGSSDEATPYTNAAYGFTLSYSEPLGIVTMDPSAGETYAIAFADKDGTLVDDQYANGLRVSVLQMDQAVKATDVLKLKKEITSVVEQMIADLPEGKTTSEVTAITLNGTPGYVVDYEASLLGEPGLGRLYLLIKGDREYHLTLQAVADDWDALEPALEKTVQTFTLE